MNKNKKTRKTAHLVQTFTFDNPNLSKAFTEAPLLSLLPFNEDLFQVISNGNVFLIRKTPNEAWKVFNYFGTHIIYSSEVMEALHTYMDPKHKISFDEFWLVIEQHLIKNGHYAAGQTIQLQKGGLEELEILPIGDGIFCYTFWVCDEFGEFGDNFPEDVAFGKMADILAHLTLMQFEKIKNTKS